MPNFDLIRDTMQVKVKNTSGNALPAYETSSSAGMDVRAVLQENISLKPLERALVKTGLFLEIPHGFECQVRPRSGLALKKGITVLNTPGTIDADYRGELKVLLMNHGKEAFEIKSGERIAQMVLAKHEVIAWLSAEELTETSRGAGGYGSTGK